MFSNILGGLLLIGAIIYLYKYIKKSSQGGGCAGCSKDCGCCSSKATEIKTKK